MGDLTKNLSWHEMDCKDGTKVPQKYRQNATNIANKVQAVCDALDAQKVIVTSAYRTPLHNNFVGGVPTSSHLEAKAIDFYLIKDGTVMNPQMVGMWIKAGDYEGGLGIYDTFTHLDIGAKRVWNKSSVVSDDNLSEYESGIIRKDHFSFMQWLEYYMKKLFSKWQWS